MVIVILSKEDRPLLLAPITPMSLSDLILLGLALSCIDLDFGLFRITAMAVCASSEIPLDGRLDSAHVPWDPSLHTITSCLYQALLHRSGSMRSSRQLTCVDPIVGIRSRFAWVEWGHEMQFHT